MKNMDKGLTAPKIYLPNLSAQAQKFGISIKKKSFIGRSQSMVSSMAE